MAITTLHIEWMVQRHYLDSIKDDQQLDPQFKSLLKHHWIEEVQHAKLDTLMVEALAANRSEEEIMRGVEEHSKSGSFRSGLQQQMEFDLNSFEQASGHTLSEAQREGFRRVQLKSGYRWTYLGTGMTHERVPKPSGSRRKHGRE